MTNWGVPGFIFLLECGSSSLIVMGMPDRLPRGVQIDEFAGRYAFRFPRGNIRHCE
jgi:hypothetical protein